MELQYFFTYGTNLPVGIGFGMFSVLHLVWILVLFGAGAALFLGYGRLPERGRGRMACGMAFSLAAWILLRTGYAVFAGADMRYELPLHLCSMTGLLCVLHCVTHWDWTGQVLYAIGLPGALLALVFPDWGYYPAVHFITIEGFVFHATIVWYVLSQLHGGGIVPAIKKSWKVLVFLAIVVPPVYFFDGVYHVNYMFVRYPSHGSPLEGLARLLGYPGYWFGYAFLVLLCIFLMNLGYFLFTRKK